MDRTADAIVVGAGVIGASIALELARAGFQVVVVDRGGGPGYGSTSASSAVVRFNYSTWDGMAAAWESKFRWERWRDHLGGGTSDTPARFIRCGLAFLDVDLMPRSRLIEMFTTARIPFKEWDPAALVAAFPGIDVGRYYPPKPVTSEEFYADAIGQLGAIYTPDAGYVDDPQLAAANLADAAAAHGASFEFRNQVVAVSETGDTWRLRCEDGQTLAAPIVVNAAGPWSAKFNELAGVGGDFKVRIAPMRQEVHHVVAPTQLLAGAPIVADADLGTYLLFDAHGNMLIGGTEPECDPLEWIDDPDSVTPNPTNERFEAQIFRAARRFPELVIPNRPRGVVGVYDVADDWTPVYDRTNADGFFVAIGTSGNQFKNAPLVGSLMTEIIVGVLNGVDHDRHPIHYQAPHTGHDINLGSFSRRRQRNPAFSGSVLG